MNESQIAFDNAIKIGRLSLDKNAPNYVGFYMYMGVDDKSGKDLFKHYDTREYLN